ncbi:MAG: hypothetical protein JXR51_08100 [Bacteroidales bacterium]|nr:hypothetical protein [Bacteroidales bacterium]
MKRKDKYYYFLLVICIGVVAYAIRGGYLDRKEVSENPRYTIGITYKASRTAKTGLMVDSYYYVNNIKYETWGYYIDGVKYPNGRYYVKFSAKNPDKSIIMFNKPVPQRIKEAPKEGWNKIPNY